MIILCVFCEKSNQCIMALTASNLILALVHIGNVTDSLAISL